MTGRPLLPVRLLDDSLRDSQDAVLATTPGLWFAEVNDSRHFRETFDDGVFATLQHCGDIFDGQEFRHASPFAVTSCNSGLI